MADNVVPGAEAFSFRGLSLHGALQQISDIDEQDVAEHRILKRNGSILEGMGWKARRFTARLAFVGPRFRAAVEDLRNQMRRESEGVLVHPLHGTLLARCTRIEGALNIPDGANGADVTLSFIEQGVDRQPRGSSVPSAAQALNAAAADFATLAAIFDAVTTSLAVASVVESAAALALAATDQVTLGTPGAPVGGLVVGVETQVMGAIAALQADPAADSDVDRWDAMAAADLVYAAALEVEAALASTRKPFVRYVTPGPTSYLAVAQVFYGGAGLDRADEILVNNPEIVDPHSIPGGASLRMYPATV